MHSGKNKTNLKTSTTIKTLLQLFIFIFYLNLFCHMNKNCVLRQSLLKSFKVNYKVSHGVFDNGDFYMQIV